MYFPDLCWFHQLVHGDSLPATIFPQDVRKCTQQYFHVMLDRVSYPLLYFPIVLFHKCLLLILDIILSLEELLDLLNIRLGFFCLLFFWKSWRWDEFDVIQITQYTIHWIGCLIDHFFLLT